MDEVLASPAMGVLLRAEGLAVQHGGKQEQTGTTQRRKPAISLSWRREPVRTRIEFSHRPADPRRVLEAVPERVVAPYALRAPTVLHYTADAAAEQKIAALALRSETQARDAFDLELLLRRQRGAVAPGQIEPELLRRAADRVLDLPFEAFGDQVLPFLDPEMGELYDRSSWEQIRSFVVERLMELVR